MQALGTPSDILPAAIRYARAMLLVMPFVFVAWAGMSLSRGTGDALSPMWALLAATLVGAVCTPLLVAGTPLGAAGVAVSTLVAQLAADDLARCRHRQVIAKHQHARILVGRQPGADEGLDLGRQGVGGRESVA